MQFTALAVLSQNPGISQADLGDELDLDRSTIADLVERMARKGLVARAQSSEDRRRKVLTITDAGERTLGELRPGVERVEELLREGLSPETGEAMRSAVLRMLEHGVRQGVLRNAATPTRERAHTLGLSPDSPMNGLKSMP